MIPFRRMGELAGFMEAEECMTGAEVNQILDGDPVSKELQAHLGVCTKCRHLVETLLRRRETRTQ